MAKTLTLVAVLTAACLPAWNANPCGNTPDGVCFVSTEKSEAGGAKSEPPAPPEAAAPPPPEPADDTAEPPLLYTLTIDGQSFDIREDQPLELPGQFNNPKVTLSVKPYREFAFSKVSFRYPRTYSFEPRHAGPSKVWTLRGRDLTIMYMDLAVKTSPAAHATNLERQLGGHELVAPMIDHQITLGGRAMTGKRVKFRRGPHLLTYSIYTIAEEPQRTHLLILMDAGVTPEASPDRALAIPMLAESFQLTE